MAEAALISNPTIELAYLADLVAGAWAGAEVELFKSNTEVGRNVALGEFTLANYDGYAAEAVTFLAPSLADDGTPEVIATVGEFRPTGAVTPNDIYGILVLGALGEMLYQARFPDGPYPMDGLLTSILVTLRFRYGEGGLVVSIS